MDRILRINYGRGKMCINVDTFFPTSRTRIRKLGRIMHMDYEHDGKDELIEMLEDRMQAIKEEWRDLYDSMGERKIKLEDAQRTLYMRRQLVDNLRKRKEKALLEDAMFSRKKAEEIERDLRLQYRAAKARLNRLERDYTALKQDVEVVKDEI